MNFAKKYKFNLVISLKKNTIYTNLISINIIIIVIKPFFFSKSRNKVNFSLVS